jgi:hypothetical protein
MKLILCECDFEIVIFEIRVSPPSRGVFWVMLSGSQIAITKNRLVDRTLHQ